MKVAKAMHKYLTKSKYIFLPLPYQKEVLLKKINQGLTAKTAILSGVFLCMLDIKIVRQVPSNHYPVLISTLPLMLLITSVPQRYFSIFIQCLHNYSSSISFSVEQAASRLVSSPSLPEHKLRSATFR